MRAKLEEDRERQIQAVMVVHNETSTGVTSDVAAVRRVMDDARHPAYALRVFRLLVTKTEQE